MITALITGIGGTRSIAVMKALRMNNDEPIRIIGTDANYFNAGSFQCDKSYVIPYASEPDYIPTLESIIKTERIDVIFGTVEKEVAVLSQNKVHLEEALGAAIIVPDVSILDICFDKYKTQEFLKESGFTYIPCIYSKDKLEIDKFVVDNGLPLIRKPVFGYGSRGLSVITTLEEVDNIELDDTYVLQKYIDNEDTETFYNTELNEYTSEIFINHDGSVSGGIIIKRALHAGETQAGYVVKDQSTIDQLAKIASTLKMRGPCNFQFRKSDGKIYIFEINPLFSGTTAIRARMGFNSVLLSVNSFVKNSPGTVSQDSLREDYFMRYLDEVFINADKIRRFKENGVTDND